MQTKRKKVVILGHSGVGKTSIINRYAVQDFVFQSTQPTLGFLFHQKKHLLNNGQQITLQIWDTAGQQRYRSIAKIYYKDAGVILVVFDVTNPDSYEQLKHWIEEVRNNTQNTARIIIIGNKIDLLDDKVQQSNKIGEVKYQQVQNYAKSIGGQFKLASAKEDKGINELFDSVAENCQMMILQKAQKLQQRRLNLKQQQKKKCEKSSCC